MSSPSKGERGNFFAVSHTAWIQICKLGMNMACLYLVLARGTQADNSTTIWSAKALEQYTGITRGRAKKAREKLVESGLIERVKAGSHPRYKLLRPEDEDMIWLPNEIVTGVEGAKTPLELVRQTADVTCLQLFIGFYGINSPVDDAGISRECVYESFTKKVIAESGEFMVLGFKRAKLHCDETHFLVNPHAISSGYRKYEPVAFLDGLKMLIDTGLVFFVPYLCESEDPGTEIIHPLMRPDTGNLILSSQANKAALSLLPDKDVGKLEKYDFVVPVRRHQKAAHVVGIGFLRYRPNTELTAEGCANTASQIDRWSAIYDALAMDTVNMQHQVGIK